MRAGAHESPVGETLIEIADRLEKFELEVMRDGPTSGRDLFDQKHRSDGVHTGDSITVAPIQTLFGPRYQTMRIRGARDPSGGSDRLRGSNVQFA